MNSTHSNFLDRVTEIAEQVATREGCRLYDIEFGSGLGGRALRIFIDKDGAGVGVDDCAKVSRGMNLLLDVEDIIPGHYNLEVSTPGIDRVLKKPWHFQKVAGKVVKIKLKTALEDFGVVHVVNKNTRNLRDILLSADENFIELGAESAGGLSPAHTDAEPQTIRVPYEQIERAVLVPEFAMGASVSGPGKPEQKKVKPVHQKHKDHPSKNKNNKNNKKFRSKAKSPTASSKNFNGNGDDIGLSAHN